MGVPQFSKKDFVLNLIEKKNQIEHNINNFGLVLAVVSLYIPVWHVCTKHFVLIFLQTHFAEQ